MINYTPRPGSKTEAAVNYLHANGGRALAVDIAEAIDTERKNLHASFSAAIAAGLMEACELPGGAGYGLCDAAPAAAAPAAAAPAAAAADKPTPAAAPAAPAKRSGRSPAAKLAKPAKAARRTQAEKEAASKTARMKRIERSRKAHELALAVPKPAPASASVAGTFRCGFFSDGTLRLEGLNRIDGGAAEVTLSAEAAHVLTDYLKGHRS